MIEGTAVISRPLMVRETALGSDELVMMQPITPSRAGGLKGNRQRRL
jgi:hypothetical protein